MKKGKLALILAVSALMLAGCNQKQNEEVEVDQNKVFNVGICQLAPHPALDAATQGFKDELEKRLGKDHVQFDLQNAAGEAVACTTIVNSFVSKKVDLIMANATPALQAAANATMEIPILGTSITEYGVALGIEGFKGFTGTNISGTSDLAPLDEQAKMITDLFPTAQKVGILYCQAESNSKYQVDVVKAELEKKNLTVELISFADSNDINSALRGKADDLDVLYIPTDNTCANNAGIIDTICQEKNLPVVAGEEGLCKGCGAVTLSISYYNIGVKTGEMAAYILKYDADIRKIDIAYDEEPVKKYNPVVCSRLGITPPADYVAIEME